jgi:D-alanine--D-alanine ligase (EC 6.3.2.4)
MTEKYRVNYKQYLKAENAFGKVAVLYGGTSAEREISLKSGAAVERGLRAMGIAATAYDIRENAIEQILSLEFDRAFIALHGAGGEDGKIQAVLDLMGKPYTGSRHTASAIAMDKLKTKQIWLSEGLSTPRYHVVKNDSDMQAIITSLGGTVFVKPVREGSSIGMCTADSASALVKAFEYANGFDHLVLAEQKITGAEFSVAILNGQALEPVELETDNDFYDYDAKYQSNNTRYKCPSSLSVEQLAEIKALAVRAFDSIGCEGWVVWM